MDLSDIIMESYSQVALYFIMGKFPTSKEISNLIADIKFLPRNLRNLTSSSYKRTSNTLADKLAKKARNVSCQAVYSSK